MACECAVTTRRLIVYRKNSGGVRVEVDHNYARGVIETDAKGNYPAGRMDISVESLRARNGAGDAVADRIVRVTGGRVKPCGGCKGRQTWLNWLVSWAQWPALTRIWFCGGKVEVTIRRRSPWKGWKHAKAQNKATAEAAET